MASTEDLTKMREANPTSFRTKALASLATVLGMLLVPAAYQMLETYGPSSRVVFYEYLPLPGAADYLLAAGLGAWLAARAYRRFSSHARYSTARLIAGCLLGSGIGLALVAVSMLGSAPSHWMNARVLLVIVSVVPVVAGWCGGIVLFKSTEPDARDPRFPWLRPSAAVFVIVWLLIPQFRAFPDEGTVAEREAWARKHVRQYASLERTVEQVPLVAENVGHVIRIAPTAHDKHTAAQDMNGVAMNFTLEVVGEKGSGILHAHCTVDGDTVFDWQPATWSFNGKTTEITTVPNLLRVGR